jgi:hypothetical protein
MSHARTVKGARLQAHVAIAAASAPHQGPSLEEDVRRVVPNWECVADLVEGTRQRGWPERHTEYLSAVCGVLWTKAFRAGQFDARTKCASELKAAAKKAHQIVDEHTGGSTERTHLSIQASVLDTAALAIERGGAP